MGLSSGVLHRVAGGGDGTLFSNPTRLRSTLAAIAEAASTGVAGSRQALQLRGGLSIPRQTSLADARDAPQSSGAAQPAQARAPATPTQHTFTPTSALSACWDTRLAVWHRAMVLCAVVRPAFLTPALRA